MDRHAGDVMVSLNEFFLDGQTDLTGHIRHALAKKDAAARAGAAQMLTWRLMPDAVAEQLAVLLNIPLSDILIGAWNKGHALRQQLQKSAKTPDKDFFLQLVEHKVASTHEPYVALLRNGQEVGRLTFTISVELVLQGAVLRIRDGRVREVQTGQIKGKGTVKLYGATVIEKELAAIKVPGTFEVGAEPITLRLSA
jgi:hypothetical protein